jgi:signal transduction histidine kinase/HPt (histidine-containing phosphotransfer) domain-containing protein/ActR/RegA family two-component response regulator
MLRAATHSAVNPTIKWLTGIAIASLVIVLGLKLVFDGLQDELNTRSANERARLFVGEEIVRGIDGIEKGLYLLAATSNPAAIRRVNRSIEVQLDKLRHDLNVLSQGGTVRRQVLLNIEGRDEMVREASYSPKEAADRHIMEAIEIGPLLDEVNAKKDGLAALLAKGWQLQESGDTRAFFAWHDEIDAYLKFLPPYFARLNENANRLFFDSSERLRQLEAELEVQRVRLKQVELAVMAAVLLLAGLGALGFVQRIDAANRQLQEAIDQMRSAKEEAERASRAKSDFVSRMSHELRTPLNAIIGFADLLEAEPLSPSHQGYVKLINDSGRHLMELINGVLDHAKIEAGGLTLEKIPFDFHAAINAVKTIVGDRAIAKGLDFTASISDQLPRYVIGDPTRLRQILINLLVNAVKFTERGSVELRIAPENERIYFSIRDTGIGMDAAAQARLFKPFSQADDSVTRKYGGTGLGLLISRELIEAMGGSIEVESAPGAGTVFWFWLPLLPAAAVPTVPPTPAAPTPSDLAALLPGKVLVVDDNRVNLQLASAMLDRLGLAHELAESGQDALNRLAGDGFSLVLMDMEMPVMDGITATKILRSREAELGGAHLPVVAMTANALQEDRERCFAAGMDGYVAKPVGLATLRAEILRLFDGHKAPAETPTVAAPAPELPVFERATAIALLGDESLLTEISALFVADVPGYLSEIDSALAAGDTARLALAAHTVKGLCATFASPSGQAAALQLEAAARSGNRAACGSAVARVRTQVEALATALAASDSGAR